MQAYTRVRRGANDEANDDSALIWNRECHWSHDWEGARRMTRKPEDLP